MADNNGTMRRRFIYDSLLKLSGRSRLIKVTPLEMQPGWPPEKYLIDYFCRSFVGIDANGEPIIGEHHRMKIYLDRDYPRTEPHMLFLTPIWHPNIGSEEPRRICTDKALTWWAGKGVDDLIIRVGEMIQYKHYHAKNEPPFPQDLTVAAWVLNHAEPRGLVGPNFPLDDRPLLESYRIRRSEVTQSVTRIRLGQPSNQSGSGEVRFTCPGCGLQSSINSNNALGVEDK
jgi:hypothetical protein